MRGAYMKNYAIQDSVEGGYLLEWKRFPDNEPCYAFTMEAQQYYTSHEVAKAVLVEQVNLHKLVELVVVPIFSHSKCKNCSRVFPKRGKKLFCSTYCRVTWHRNSK